MNKTDLSNIENENVKLLVVKFAVPAVFALLIQSIYNVIDTIYVGHSLGGYGISAMTVVFPMVLLMQSMSNLLSIGGGALISMELGAKRNRKADLIAGNVISGTIIMGIIVTILGFIYIKPILIFFGATPSIYEFTRQYMLIAFGGMVFSFLLLAFYSILRAVGKVKIVMYTTFVSVILNIVLAPLFLFVFKWGMYGVSLATLLAQVVVLVYVVIYFLKQKTVLRIIKTDFLIKYNIIRQSVLIGSSSFLRMSGAAFITVITNHLAFIYGGPLAIGAIGIAYRVLTVLFMPVIGFVQGNQPIIGYCFGAKNKKRIREVLRFTIIVNVIMMFVFIVICHFYVHQIVYIFGNNPFIIKNTPYFMNIILLGMPLLAYQAIISGYLQAVGRYIASNVVSMLRQYVFFLPCLYILPMFFKIDGLLYAFPLSTILPFFIILIWMRFDTKKFLR
ncbi:MAG: MATE family efflux transporter [bacterium]|nr:MATE family efflux transporter [bacterium]